jgi:hypothetical protein
MTKTHFLSAWHSGKATSPSGGTFGLRFGVLRDVLITGQPAQIELHLEGEAPFLANVTPGFWNNCPEIRAPEIRTWMKKQGHTFPWADGKPPRFAVTKTAEGFRVYKSKP